MFGIGPMELVVIVVVALLIFGPQRLPEFARTLGKGLAEFRRASNDLRQTLALDELQSDLRKTASQVTSPPKTAPRPAQTGDTLPPGPGSAAATAAASPVETPPWKDHPGQLPEGGDFDHRDFDHRDPDHRDPDHRQDPATPDATESIADPSPRLAAADPGLGSVPVGGADPAATRRG